jgi:hypothetical protein
LSVLVLAAERDKQRDSTIHKRTDTFFMVFSLVRPVDGSIG